MKFEPSSIVLHKFKRRVGVGAVVVAGHILVGLALCLQLNGPGEKSAGDQGVMVTASLVLTLEPVGSVAQSRSKPEASGHRALPTAIEGLERAINSEESSSPSLSEVDMALVGSFQLISAGEPGAACNLAQDLAEAFAQSPEVQKGIAAIPASGRSVANAVMLWDGHWAEGTQSGGTALLRALLVKAVVSSRPECLLATNQGPVLFLIPDRQTTVVLAVGSGQWRWVDILTPSPKPDVMASIF